ncbi:MAG: DNA-binding response OmpR family regulator [Oleiphilaceae bacterium]|jgi:DNA-binding response OmpR family regulator
MTILLVEDNPDEEALALIAFKKSGIDQQIAVARDGQEAVDYMLAQGVYHERDVKALPSVIFLDINLPKLSGLEVLKILRQEERTKLVPVVLLTSSDQEQDMIDGYSLGANSYIRKPFDFNEFLLQIKTLGNYWIDNNRTPYATRR